MSQNPIFDQKVTDQTKACFERLTPLLSAGMDQQYYEGAALVTGLIAAMMAREALRDAFKLFSNGAAHPLNELKDRIADFSTIIHDTEKQLQAFNEKNGIPN